jgi:ABC-type branched-subunit amino acid transport system ATPase component
MAIKNKVTFVDMKNGVMKVNNGAGSTNVVVKVHGATSQTTGSVEMNEETTTTNS